MRSAIYAEMQYSYSLFPYPFSVFISFLTYGFFFHRNIITFAVYLPHRAVGTAA